MFRETQMFLIISIFKYGSLGMISIQYYRLGKRVFGLEIFELILILCLDKTTLMTSSIEILVRFVYMCIINTHIICMLFIYIYITRHYVACISSPIQISSDSGSRMLLTV